MTVKGGYKMSKSQEDFAKAFITPIAKVDWACPQWALWQASEQAFKLRVVEMLETAHIATLREDLIETIRDM